MKTRIGRTERAYLESEATLVERIHRLEYRLDAAMTIVRGLTKYGEMPVEDFTNLLVDARVLVAALDGKDKSC